MNTPSFFCFTFLFPLMAIADLTVNYVTKYIEVPIDHFSFANSDTFKLRYLENNTFWRPNEGAPIFFYTGNEGDVTQFCNNTGFMWEIAPYFNALIIFAEHRYYGLSLPYGNKSFEGKQQSGYLTSTQALADYIDLIEYLRALYYKIPVIAFGGSYGGMLAAWIRMKYPASVAGSVASSAPIWQFTGMTPCYAFNRVTTSTYKSTSEICYENIKNSWKAIDNQTSTDKGKTWLSSAFKLCKPLTSNKNVTQLKDWLKDIYVNIAMVNYPYAANFLADLPAYPMRKFCSHFHEVIKSEVKLLTVLFEAVSMYFNSTGKVKCLNLEEDTSPYISQNGWDYQSCMEMVMPMCDDGKHDMFEASPWNFTIYSDECFNKYGLRPQENLIRHLYGGKMIKSASNIIFSNGLMDPWSSGGVLYNVSKSLLAVIIPESAHHLDLRASNPEDPESVRIARKVYIYYIKRWLKEYYQRS